MKITNISSNPIYLRDLKFVPQAQTEGRRGEDRYLAPGGSVYLPTTSQVLRSAYDGDLRAWLEAGIVRLDDLVNLAANGNPGDTVTLTHNLGYAPPVFVLKKVGVTWVDGTGTFDAVHNVTPGITPQVFVSVAITNTTAGALDFLIRVG